MKLTAQQYWKLGKEAIRLNGYIPEKHYQAITTCECLWYAVAEKLPEILNNDEWLDAVWDDICWNGVSSENHITQSKDVRWLEDLIDKTFFSYVGGACDYDEAIEIELNDQWTKEDIEKIVGEKVGDEIDE